jgi:hypothetical protein
MIECVPLAYFLFPVDIDGEIERPLQPHVPIRQRTIRMHSFYCDFAHLM